MVKYYEHNNNVNIFANTKKIKAGFSFNIWIQASL